MENESIKIARLIELPKIKDPRGNLTAIESGKDVPFEVLRNYWIYDVPSGMWRDGHAFKQQQEFIVALSGSFDVVVNDGVNEQTFHYDADDYIEDFENFKILKNGKAE